MEEISKILKLWEVIRKENLKIEELPLAKILLDSLVYDKEFWKEEVNLFSLREKTVNEFFINWTNNYLDLNIKTKIQNITEKIKENIEVKQLTKNKGLLCTAIIIKIIENTQIYFWVEKKKKKPLINTENYNEKEALTNIINLTHYIIYNQLFPRFNFSKSLIICNYLLTDILWFPWIVFSSKSKKRLWRTIDYYIDFEKEFLLTLSWECYKVIYMNKFPEKIRSIKSIEEEKGYKKIYIKPGTWWYWDDRQKYTFVK